MEFIAKVIQDYADNFTDKEPALLSQLNRDTYLKVMYPRMCSGHFQGRLLSFLSKLVNPKFIVEVGTYTGYSTQCLAEGLQADGRIYTIDVDVETADFANDYFLQSEHKSKIFQLIGSGIEILTDLEKNTQKFNSGVIDLAFIDANKEQYLDYYQLIIPKMRSGGLIIADNVLWSGNVVEKSIGDEDTEALKKFNNFVVSDERVERILMPVRDGLYLIRKI